MVAGTPLLKLPNESLTFVRVTVISCALLTPSVDDELIRRAAHPARAHETGAARDFSAAYAAERMSEGKDERVLAAGAAASAFNSREADVERCTTMELPRDHTQELHRRRPAIELERADVVRALPLEAALIELRHARGRTCVDGRAAFEERVRQSRATIVLQRAEFRTGVADVVRATRRGRRSGAEVTAGGIVAQVKALGDDGAADVEKVNSGLAELQDGVLNGQRRGWARLRRDALVEIRRYLLARDSQ